MKDPKLGSDVPKLYTELASWFHLLTSPTEYAEDARFYGDVLQSECDGPLRNLLELGSGGGNVASHMKQRFMLTLVDLSPEMIELSKTINPEVEHIIGDMRSVRLERVFDAVLIHDAISYITTESDLRRTLDTAFVHLRSGGAAVFAPDHTRENFRATTGCGGHDGERRAMRYVEWLWDPDPDDTTYTQDFAYLLRDSDGSVQVEHDRHVMGLFGRDVWLRILTEVGFDAEVLSFDHSKAPSGSYEAFVAIKPMRAGD